MFLTSPLIEWRRSPVLIQHVSELRVETTWRALIDATKRKRIFPLTKILNSNFGCGFIFVWISNSSDSCLSAQHYQQLLQLLRDKPSKFLEYVSLILMSPKSINYCPCEIRKSDKKFRVLLSRLKDLPLAFQREVFQEIVRRTNIISFVTKFYLHLQST
jgi:hypothetical protein